MAAPVVVGERLAGDVEDHGRMGDVHSGPLARRRRKLRIVGLVV
jgi:hypothetical protein